MAWVDTLPAWEKAVVTCRGRGDRPRRTLPGAALVRRDRAHPVAGAFTAAALLLVVGITLFMTQVA
jgi:hypothetical protein